MSDESDVSEERTVFDLTFDQTVIVTKSFYPPLSFTTLFTQLGGSLGLWLGIGMMQMCISLTQIIFKLRKLVSTM